MSNRKKQVIGIVVVWPLVSLVITLYDYLAYQAIVSTGVNIEYSIYKSLCINVVVGILAALAGGNFLVYCINERYRDLPYYKSYLIILASFLAVSSSLVILVSGALSLTVSESGSWEILKGFIFDIGNLKTGLICLIILLLTPMLLQIKDKFGDRVLKDLITGKYQRPKEETRIFMFVDLISSTTIAERWYSGRRKTLN